MAGLLRWTPDLANSPKSKLHCHVQVYFRPSRRRTPDGDVRFWPKADMAVIQPLRFQVRLRAMQSSAERYQYGCEGYKAGLRRLAECGCG
jgi:hypothetical protein